MGNNAFNPFDPSQMAAFQQQQVSNQNPAPQVPSSDTLGNLSAVPSASPSAPTAPPQQQTRGGAIKQFLTNYLGTVASRIEGMPSPYEQEQTKLKNFLALQQSQNQTQQVATQANAANALADYHRTLAQQYQMVPYQLPDGTEIQVQQKDIGKLGSAVIGNQGKVDVANIRAQVQDRLAQAQLGLRQALADRNFDLAQQRLAEMGRFRQAELGLQQGRFDMAREALDFREEGPTAQTRTAGQFAGTLIPKIDLIKGQIDKLDAEGKLGPIEGRWNDFLAGKIGNGDPEYDQFRTELSLFASGAARAHTSRTGIEAINYFKSLLAQPGATAGQLKAQLDAVRPYLEGYKAAGQFTPPNRGNQSPQQPPAPPATNNDPFAAFGGRKR